jgi:hypothetical protein
MTAIAEPPLDRHRRYQLADTRRFAAPEVAASLPHADFTKSF